MASDARRGRSTGRASRRASTGHLSPAAALTPNGTTSRASPRTVVHLVPHTHWDREWYEPFQTFRLRLVDLVDTLLDRMETDRRLRFTLDGQCATVDDYLEIRREREGTIRRLVAEGRLAIGPWQILMDEFLVSGETIVRNLQLGWARATDLGGAMPVGYLPDMFGHVAQMPQILRRAGIENAAVWRGVPAAIDRNHFTWVAPDGSSVETEYLVGGYGSGAYLFDVPGRIAARIREHTAAVGRFYGSRDLLAMYGTDHAVPSPGLADLVDAINREGSGVVVRLETLAEYALRDGEQDDGPRRRWQGELRSAARANMLPNVTSARVDIKRAAARAERLLERYAEPLSALYAAMWPHRPLELAWRRVIENSAHDSICGCSHDAVAAQVLTRFAEAEQLGRGVLAKALDAIAQDVPASAWAAVNPTPQPRADLVELDAAVPTAWIPAVLAAGAVVPVQQIGSPDSVLADLRLRGSAIPELLARKRHGRELFQHQINGIEVEPGPRSPALTVVVDRVADPRDLDVEELIQHATAAARRFPRASWRVVVRASARRRILARVPVPPLGWTRVEIVDATGSAHADLDDRVLADGRTLDNGLVRAVVGLDGTLTLSGGGARLKGVGRIVDGGDYGDSYNYAPPSRDRLVDVPADVTVERGETGPLRAGLAVQRRYRWPVSLEAGASRRSRVVASTEVVTRLELRSGEPFLRVRVEFDNRSRDHRVRFHVPLPRRATGSAAEGQFAVVERGLETEGGYGERPVPTFPARGFVHTRGVTVLLEHVLEYEVVDGRELALTLLRSVGLISRNDNPYREDPAGPQTPIPAAQMLGEWSVGFALMPHVGSWADAGVLAAAERFQHPLLVVPGTRVGGRGADAADGSGRGLEIDGEAVTLAALTRRDGWLEARIVAQRASSTVAVVRGAFDAVRETDLLGRPSGPIEGARGTVRVELGPWQIRTLQLRPTDDRARSRNGPLGRGLV